MATSSSLLLNHTYQQLSDLCAEFALNQSSSTIESIVDQSHPETWQIWLIGLAFVTVISVSAAAGIILLPLLSPAIYNNSLTYLVALGVGTLSGSAIFTLLPEAFDLRENENYMQKSWMLIFGIYLFFMVDKFLNLIADLRERRKSKVSPTKNGTGGKMRLCSHSSSSPTTDKQTNGTIVGGPKVSNGTTPTTALNIVDTMPDTYTSGRPLSVEIEKSEQVQPTAIASVAWLIIFGDGLHNFIDGLSIGAAFNYSLLSGISISVAVLCEEFPHELGDCAILINSGMSLKQALFYNLASASTCYMGFVIGVLVGEMDERFASYIFALAAGMFLYISLSSMLSEMNKKCEEQMMINMHAGFITLFLQCAGIITGLTIMFIMGTYGDQIQF